MFDEHLMIISKLINNLWIQHQGAVSIFQDYVLAACAQKIYHQLTHSKLSRPFIYSLGHISVFQFKSAHLKKHCSDELFHIHIPLLARAFLDKIPNLTKQAQAGFGNTYQLYTTDTCAEFHWLLCNLLQTFENALKKLLASLKQDQFAKHLANVASYGGGLWSLSRSGVF